MLYRYEITSLLLTHYFPMYMSDDHISPFGDDIIMGALMFSYWSKTPFQNHSFLGYCPSLHRYGLCSKMYNFAFSTSCVKKPSLPSNPDHSVTALSLYLPFCQPFCHLQFYQEWFYIYFQIINNCLEYCWAQYHCLWIPTRNYDSPLMTIFDISQLASS